MEDADGEETFISIHAPPRGATQRKLAARRNPYFNSRPSARGDDAADSVRKTSQGISIHAPPRGATVDEQPPPDHGTISIHAPPRGATVSRSASPAALPFQFTPLREGRPRGRPLVAGAHGISIHAPPRGSASSNPAANLNRSWDFNSRPSARGDRFARQRGQALHISIHAPPRGATMKPVLLFDKLIQFQFTPLREGRPSPDTTTGRDNHISIHAPPRGATAQDGRRHAERRISIHAPPRGATSRPAASAKSSISIHAPPRGATGITASSNNSSVFQFTPLREGRPATPESSRCGSSYFNSRPSARGDDDNGK